MKKNMAHKLLAYAKKHPQGFTVKLKSGRIMRVKPSKKNRYAVSTTNLKSKKAIIRHFKNKRSGVAGGWYDKESKKYYIDTTLIKSNRSKALKTAKKHKQKAIFDLLKNKEIKVKRR